MTPSELAAELMEIVAEVCNCRVMWTQHPDAITIYEAARISTRIERYMEEVCTRAGQLNFPITKEKNNA